MFTTFINPIAILLSLSTATGILVHDTKIDKATMTALSTPVQTAAYETDIKGMNMHPELHTHVEKSSISHALSELRGETPRTQPRAGDDKKHLLPKNVRKGHHPFDNYSLPIA